MKHPEEKGRPRCVHAGGPAGAADAGGLPLIGAHVRTTGGLARVPERAHSVGAEVVQIFNTNPRIWRPRLPPSAEIAALTNGLSECGIPLFIHTIYLINLASPDDQLRQRSAAALSEALVLGSLTGAEGVVTHVGSHRGHGFEAATDWVIEAVHTATRMAAEALDTHGRPGSLPPLLLENGAGSGATVGGRLEELSELLPPLLPSCGVCLDTAHLFASGYAVHTAAGLRDLVRELRERALLGSVKLIHINDSKAPFASNRDRHENPGEGHIGLAGLTRVVKHAAFASIPFVLESPGLDGKGPDAANVALVKLMRAAAPNPRGVLPPSA